MEKKLKISKKINFFLIHLNKGYFKTNVKISFLYIIGSLFYYLSLARVNINGFKCLKKENFLCFFAIIENVLISSILISISIYIIFIFKLSKFHLFNIFIIYIFFLLINHDSQIVRHGIYNFLAFIFLLFFSFILYFYIKCLYFFAKLLKYRKIFFFIFLCISFSPIFLVVNIYRVNHFSCKNWTKGFNDSYIDNASKDYPCLINIPKNNTCYLPEIGNFFNFYSKFRPSCLDNQLWQSQSNYFLKSIKKLNIKYYNISNKNYFGFPLTNNDKFTIIEYGSLLNKGVKNLEQDLHRNIILMDLFKKNKTKYYPNESTPEIYIKFQKGRGKIEIKVQKNKTLIKEKGKMANHNKKLRYKNVIVMFFDTLSRAHFFRKFPKTVSFLNKFSKYETNFSKKKTTIFQFFKYNSIKPITTPNIRAAYYGAKNNGKGTYFAKYFKNQGYILGKASTYCEKSNFIFSRKNNELNDIRWDHEGISFSCIKGIYRGLFIYRLTSLIRKCLFGKQIFEYAIEYLESFLKAYYDYNKMFLFESGEGHEPTGQVIGFLDDILYKFLLNLNSKNYFSNTTIIIFSDHGQHLNGLSYYFKLKDFFIERTLPFLLLIIPNTQELYNEFLYENIKSNQQVFITAYDIYYTLIHIALGDQISKINANLSNNYGKSLLTPINYSLRYCESKIYDSQIFPKFCNCKLNIKL